jgi:hypothetical protein
MKTYLSVLSVAALLVIAQVARAWNAGGHAIVDLIAWGELAESDRAAAVSLLRDHPRFDQHFLDRMPPDVWKASPAEQDAWAFAHAGTWPDIVRSPRGAVTREDVALFNRPTWHYINLCHFPAPADRDELAPLLDVNRSTEPPADPDEREQNVAQAMGSAMRVLGDGAAPRARRAVALCWLLHLAGDAHQPAHAGSLYTRDRFRTGDRGANQIPVRGRGGNLHSAWDASITTSRRLNDWRGDAVRLTSRHREAGQAATAELTAKAWLMESFALGRKLVYAPEVLAAVQRPASEGDLEPLALSPEYLQAAGQTSQRRAVEAGFRIAAILAGNLPPSDDQLRGFDRPAPVTSLAPRPTTEKPEATKPAASESAHSHWINTRTGARHNSTCRWFGKTSHGRYCGPDEGHACGQCGG